jgi:Zn-dependent protease
MGGSGWWFAEYWDFMPMLAIGWTFWVITSICLHELAHGLAAIKLGDNTPLYTGHMTWNPLVHMGKMSLVMFALVGIAFGAMPVNPSRFNHRYGDAIVAFAGPLCNLLIFITLMPMLIGWKKFANGKVDPQLYMNVFVFLNAGCALNLILFMFNLIPVPPLDGSRILGDFYPRFNELWRGPNAQYMAIGAFIFVFFVFGRKVGDLGFAISRAVLDWGVGLLGTV